MSAKRRRHTVALFVDGIGLVNGVAEFYRQVLPRLPGHITPVVVACRGGSARADLELPGVGLRAPRVMPEVDWLLPDPAAVASALSAIRPSVIHVAGPGPLGIAGLVASRRLGVPLVASFHTDVAAYGRSWTGSRHLAGACRAVVRRFYRRASVVIAPTQLAAGRAADLCGLSPEQVRVVRQGVDCHRFRPEVSRSNGEAVVALTVVRLSPEKGLSLLLAAHRSLPTTPLPALVVVGRGPLRRALERRAHPDVRFTGLVTGGSLAHLYATADLFVLPSPTETAGQVLLEAKASGLPCLVSPTGAARESVAHGATGLVAESDTVEAFATGLRWLVEHPTERRAMGREARGSVLSQSWDQAARHLAEVYETAGAR